MYTVCSEMGSTNFEYVNKLHKVVVNRYLKKKVKGSSFIYPQIIVDLLIRAINIPFCNYRGASQWNLYEEWTINISFKNAVDYIIDQNSTMLCPENYAFWKTKYLQ